MYFELLHKLVDCVVVRRAGNLLGVEEDAAVS